MPSQILEEAVQARADGIAGHISLDRPKAIHALTLGMCRAMRRALDEWESDPHIALVMIDHAGGRGFCAGGDVAKVRRSALDDGGMSGRAFFHAEYRLNYRLFTYPKPVVAFMDGITMGGGVGLSQPARFRVATENTRFAMPETAIGLFPDVGGGWYLSRLQGRLGQFLALTGARLDGAECLWAGLATHYLPSERLEDAKQRLAAGHEIASVLNDLSVKPPEPRIAVQAAEIARHFASDSLEDILHSLADDPSDWALDQLALLQTRSPTSCKVALRQLAIGAGLETFADEMVMEYRLAARTILQPDFAEGVRAVLVDKDNSPHWHPAASQDVTEAMLDAIFAALPAEEEWTPQ
ncbi:enoyl-CoA hydratase/isomerase family protein [Novosphingobium sp. 9]|uniref:enoyl-CoA hydratase/isomerase family protein n=1 Tax=Novosphingobium sp. 9 TaxID=2025349 RepID=UPI0021B558AE|nr:enoyl-CoA hydratase/isomerase family protein [Novosphingobium sp. 9]